MFNIKQNSIYFRVSEPNVTSVTPTAHCMQRRILNFSSHIPEI